MTDITNKITNEETEAYIESIETEITKNNNSYKWARTGVITLGMGLPLAIVGLTTAMFGALGLGSLIIFYGSGKQIYYNHKTNKTINKTKQNIDEIYK
ncbi:MAG: hypothetical protein ABIC91_05850 [Nanoarchaeota archaeon]|nr:hypothetical protein [Nanoarchaeota archaeon]MBU1030972.1 hypothetical protein [Nanoarchaeota archaeon]MBU1850163.1 hypothetical protein [Nanoarchaeota archaeon]